MRQREILTNYCTPAVRTDGRDMKLHTDRM